MVVKLEKLLSDCRASRVNIRRTTDIMFPDTPSYPLKLKLAASGALGDIGLPGPAVPDSGEKWELMNQDEDSGDDQDPGDIVDGCLGENRQKLISEYVEAIVLDPEESVPEDSEDLQKLLDLAKDDVGERYTRRRNIYWSVIYVFVLYRFSLNIFREVPPNQMFFAAAIILSIPGTFSTPSNA